MERESRIKIYKLKEEKMNQEVVTKSRYAELEILWQLGEKQVDVNGTSILLDDEIFKALNECYIDRAVERFV